MAKTSTGKIKVNLALEPDAYELLKQMAPNRRAYGDFVSTLLRTNALVHIDPDAHNMLKAMGARLDNLAKEHDEIRRALAESKQQIAENDRLLAQLTTEQALFKAELDPSPEPAGDVNS